MHQILREMSRICPAPIQNTQERGPMVCTVSPPLLSSPLLLSLMTLASFNSMLLCGMWASCLTKSKRPGPNQVESKAQQAIETTPGKVWTVVLCAHHNRRIMCLRDVHNLTL